MVRPLQPLADAGPASWSLLLADTRYLFSCSLRAPDTSKMITCLGELPVQEVGMGRGMCADQFPTGSCSVLRVKASRKAGGVPENICLTTKPRGECFFLITSSKRCKAKALGLCFCHHTSPPFCAALPRPLHLLLELGTAGFLPAAVNELGAELCMSLTYTCQIHSLSNPFPHPQPPICQWIVRHQHIHLRLPSKLPEGAARTDRQEGNVLNSPFASDEFPGDCSC